MRRAGYDESDLRLVETEVEKSLVAEGIPPGRVSNFARERARCKVHSESIGLDFRLTDAVRVRIVHCGCDNWLQPVDPPPTDLVAMAHDLAEEILWCWRQCDNAMALLALVRGGLEREVGKAAEQGMDWRIDDVSLANFDTFRGRSLATDAAFYLLHDSLLGWSRWTQWFDTPASVRRFFLSTRRYQLYLKERREDLAKLNAKGVVDKVVADALRDAGFDPLQVIANYRTDGFPDLGELKLIPRWKAGILLGLLDLAPGIQWDFGNTYLWGEYPGWQDVEHPPGSMIRDIIGSRLLPKNAPIICTQHQDTAKNLMIDPEVELFNVVDGKFVWTGAKGLTARSIGIPAAVGTGPQKLPTRS